MNTFGPNFFFHFHAKVKKCHISFSEKLPKWHFFTRGHSDPDLSSVNHITILPSLCQNKQKKSLSVLPSCGATVTQNLTHLVQDITSNPTTKVCAYTLCPVSESVNRIRLDFMVCTQ
jgi:hypothetical protein